MGTLEFNAIRDYLLEVGCKIEYPILVNAFKKHLYNPDPNVQGTIRNKFKDYVNKLATVSVENNMKFIILRPEFRPKTNNPSTIDSQQVSAPLVENSSVSAITPKQKIPIVTPKVSPRASASISTQPPPVPQHQRNPLNQTVLSAPQQQPPPPAAKFLVQEHSNVSPPQRQQPPYYPQNQKNVLSEQQSNHTETKNHTYHDVHDGAAKVNQSSPTLPSVIRRSMNQQKHAFQTQRPESLNLSSQMPPPRPPPRRRQSTASLFKQSPKPIEKSNEIQDLAKRSPGRVKEHALRFNSTTSSSELNALMPMRSNTMKENRLSRDSTIGSLSSALQRNGLQLTSRSRSSHREDESDSSSLQPIDPLRRKWAIEACSCNYNGLLTLLREDPKLAYYKDIVNGYTALHWAAKFGNLDIIKLIAGTHGVSANIKSSAGYTPLHIAAMFNKAAVTELLIKSYNASPNIRDHSGKLPKQYWKQVP